MQEHPEEVAAWPSPQLIDRYLVTLRLASAKAPDAEDILAESRTTCARLRPAIATAGSTRRPPNARLKAFGSPRLVTRAFADARKRGLAVPYLHPQDWAGGRHLPARSCCCSACC